MSPVTFTMHDHVASPAPALAGGKVVLSRLGRGETLMSGGAPSIKLLLEGEEVYKVDGRSHRLCPGRMLFVDRGAVYEATIRGERTRGLCVYLPHFAPAAVDAHDPGLLGRTVMRAMDATPLGRTLAAAARAAHLTGEGWEAEASEIARIAEAALAGTLHEAATHLQRLDLKKLSTRREVMSRLEAARAHLHEHTDRSVPLAELAEVAGLSGFHLARYFSAVFGAPPGRYHRSVRLDHAAGLLRSGHHSATDVAEIVGYAELSAFSHAFSREFGRPPSSA